MSKLFDRINIVHLSLRGSYIKLKNNVKMADRKRRLDVDGSSSVHKKTREDERKAQQLIR